MRKRHGHRKREESEKKTEARTEKRERLLDLVYLNLSKLFSFFCFISPPKAASLASKRRKKKNVSSFFVPDSLCCFPDRDKATLTHCDTRRGPRNEEKHGSSRNGRAR